MTDPENHNDVEASQQSAPPPGPDGDASPDPAEAIQDAAQLHSALVSGRVKPAGFDSAVAGGESAIADGLRAAAAAAAAGADAAYA